MLELFLDQAEHRSELREQQNLATFGQQFFEHLHQAVELARGALFAVDRHVLIDQAQVTADLTQLEQRFENDDLAACHAFAGDFVPDLFVHRQAHGFVHIALRVVEVDPVDDLGLGWQFGRHLFLGTAQQEWLDARIEVMQAVLVAMLFDGGAVVAVEFLAVAQPAGHQEVKQRPQLAQVVFQRRTAQAQALAGVEVACGLGGLAVGVLDVLGFIENQHVEGLLFEQLQVPW